MTTQSPIASPPAATAATATRSAQQGDSWQELGAGLEERWWQDDSAAGLDLYALRADLSKFDVGVGYDPEAPHLVADWADLTSADVVFNAGFFDSGNRATALVVAGATPSGSSYGDFGGMLAASPSGVDLTWLARTPFRSTDGIEAAIQSAPMLLHDGEVVYTDTSEDRSRRTVVGLDRQGRLLVLVAPAGGYTLGELAQRVNDPELDLTSALNLDGGSSSGLFVATPNRHIPSLVPLPAVVTLRRLP